MLELLVEFIQLSGSLRPTYPDSLGGPDPKYNETIRSFGSSAIHELVEVVYSQVSGTRGDVSDQRLMDFLPGYRLIHIDDLTICHSAVSKMIGKRNVLPLLANYSSDFICIYDDAIYDLSHEAPELMMMHKSPVGFLRTICEFYHRGIYFLDDDGYLDYDSDQEAICGSELNPGVAYWSE